MCRWISIYYYIEVKMKNTRKNDVRMKPKANNTLNTNI